MDSKRPDRRRFLKGSASLAGLAAGGVQVTNGQTQGTPPKKIEELRSRISERFGLAPEHRWNTVAPLFRRPVKAADRPTKLDVRCNVDFAYKRNVSAEHSPRGPTS